MADDFELRLKGLEDRETILYKYMDEQRLQSLKMDRQHDDMLLRFEENEKRIEQNEEGLREQRDRSDQNERMIVSLAKKQGDLVQSHKAQVEMQAMILRVLERIDQKVDDLGKSGKNGHT